MLSAVHDAEGQALSTIATERLSLLHASFKTQHQMPATVTTHSFEEAVAKLLHRYKEGRTSGKYTVNMRNYWTTPDSLVKVMTAGLSTNQERFASPLDFNPSFGRYYSPFQEDSIFGASGDAYSCKWTGSLQAHPEHSPKDMQKAVRWAIDSSLQTAKPSLTTFLLPFDVKSGSAYQQWLGHPAVSKIACIPKKAIRLQMPDAWQTGVPFSRHAKDDMLLFTVGNSQGFSTFVNPALLEQGLQQFMRRARMIFAYTLQSLSNQLQMSTLPFFAPRGCTDDIPDSEERPREPSDTPLPDSCLDPKPLKWQADQIIYTDGSIRYTREPGYYRSGTEAYRPASDVGPKRSAVH